MSVYSKIRLRSAERPARAGSSAIGSAVASAVAVLGALAPLVFAQGQPSRHERFQLFNDCRPTKVVVGAMSRDARAVGVTEERLKADAESRLREAQLHDADATSSTLYVNVGVFDSSFHTAVRFNKRLYDVWAEEAYLAATWHKVFVGTHAGDGDFIVSGITESIDVFIREYLRVNESACESP